jgi:dTDP-4-amino-4,6-dideoxygalactose transaminase
MHVRKKLDIGWLDLAFGIARSFVSGRKCWSPGDDGLVCLSVRSGFDLLLKALALPAGSEILISAVTIRDMVRIIEEHGLVAVPIDLDMGALSVRTGQLARRIGPRTAAILVAHLFGSRMPMEPVIRAARSRGLLVIEDCAQAFSGNDYRGHPESDVSLFSFGPIKTATALGGAILRVRDARLRARMRSLQNSYPRQSRREYLGKLLKYSGLKLLSYRLPYALFVAACRVLGANHDSVVGGAARSFAGLDFFPAIRRQPAPALVALLERRLKRFDDRAIAARIHSAKLLLDQLPAAVHPGARAAVHTHWVVPVYCEFPDELLHRLWQQGFDATRGTSSLYVVPPEAGEAGRVMAGVVYLPVNPGMSRRTLERLARATREFLSASPEPAAPATIII